MNSKKYRKYTYKKDHSFFVIEEDTVGWYLIIYCESKSSNDYLFDTLEEALFEAENKFNIPKNEWQEEISTQSI